MDTNNALNQYKKDVLSVEVEAANPHRLIQMLFEGALGRIAVAKHQMEENDIAEKGKNISSAISIIAGLQASLDFEKGGEVAQNLDALYEHIKMELLQANIHNDTSKLDEIREILLEIKSAWDTIAAEVNPQPASTNSSTATNDE